MPVMIFYGLEEDDRDLLHFQKLAQYNNDTIFAYTMDPWMREHSQIPPDSKIALYKNFDEGVVFMKGNNNPLS